MRRKRIDSPTVAVEIAAKSAREVAPPSHVRMHDNDWPYWHSVVVECARSEWTDHQLELAAFLARDMADVERIQFELRGNEVVTSERGADMPNPLLATLRMKTTNILALRRSLGLHARARDGDNRETAKRRDIAKGIEAGFGADDDDAQYLARPN